MPEQRDRYIFANETHVPPGVTQCIRVILKNWDNVDDPDHLYLGGFAEGVDFTLMPNHVNGHEQLRALRLSAINPVTGPIIGVNHTLSDVYIKAGNKETDNIHSVWTGTVASTVLGGKVVTEDFATMAEMRMVEDGSYKVTRIKIYSDSASLQRAIMEAMASSGTPII